MADLKLIAGERVRNINHNSTRTGWVGVVVAERTDIKLVSDSCYHVRFDNGTVQSYAKGCSSTYLERVERGLPYHKLGIWCITYCAYDEVVRIVKLGKSVKEAVAHIGLHYDNKFINELRNFMRSRGDLYGTSITEVYAGDLSKLEELCAQPISYKMVHDEIQFTPIKRRTLKKVRRNVINGKTQDDYVRDAGHARGVQQFNTRCLGRSTGQALRVIGDAMCNPNTEIRITGIDHAISDGFTNAPRSHLDLHFRNLVQSLIGNMKGFTLTNSHVTFNPIVTEETYVERN